MTDKIDVRDLPKDQVKFIEEFVNFLRGRMKRGDTKAEVKEEVTFNSWPLGVKGKLTRREIYDYL